MSPLLPDDLRAAPRVMLARSEAAIPGPKALPGGTRWEPKWDGWRRTVVRDEGTTTLWSRTGTNLTRAFPELVAAASVHLPAGTVLDGEAVVWSGDRLNFDALTRRANSTSAALAARLPASYAAFDVLARDGEDLRARSWQRRRAVLEDLAAGWAPPLNLSPATSDPTLAATWFEDLTAAGIEGLVAKGAAQTYRPGARGWIKTKHRSSLDAIAGAVIGSHAAPSMVVVGLPLDGALRIVGTTVPLSATTARQLARTVRSPERAHPWPPILPASRVQGFGAGRDDVHLTLIAPIVVEVSADIAWSGRAFRHPLRLLRVRPDVDPGDVTTPVHLLKEAPQGQ